MWSLAILTFLISIAAVPAQDWHTCSDETFCDRIRNRGITTSVILQLESIVLEENALKANLSVEGEDLNLGLEIGAFEGDIFRVTIDDLSNPRFRADQSLRDDLVRENLIFDQSQDGRIGLRVGADTSLILEFSPLKISVFKGDDPILIVNEENLINFNLQGDKAVALDFAFPRGSNFYGIPEHAEGLSLRFTGPDLLNPYRLYSADYPAYPVGTQEALYGAIPVLYGVGIEGTSGIFWSNPSQTFVDVIQLGDEGIRALFISETGILDFFVLPGPTLRDSVKQYSSITGVTPLPQYHNLGHHQCRWSYMSQDDVQTVISEFDNHNLPLDVIWLDIDYTDGYRYFTWNYTAFPDPLGLQEFIEDSGRRAVMIVDPHIKVDPDYFVWNHCTQNGLFVKNPNGSDYQASCWPDLSSWIDFLNRDAVDYYVSLFTKENYRDVSDIVQIWNDMNEPAVFDVEEKTFPRDLVHFGNVEHRELHNLYGLTQTIATHRALLERYNGTQRPFVLTRSHYAGIQRFSAVWTGDNYASWEHLRISFAICLTEALAGVSFCGADVGGFAGDPSQILLIRWYQAGAFLPFFRAHSEYYTPRREPYLYPEEVVDKIRNAIQLRYNFLPIWYTLFYEHERYAEPVITPLSYWYPSESTVLDIDNQWLVGRDVLVRPVAEEDVREVKVYLPGGEDELWFDTVNNQLYRGLGFYTISVTLDSVPVYYRGGSIIAKKLIPRPSSILARADPYTLYVFLNVENSAEGTLYIDDLTSFQYRDGVYNYFRFVYNNNTLSVSRIDEDAIYDEGESILIDAIFIYRPPNLREEVAETSSRTTHKIHYSQDGSHMKIVDLDLELSHGLSVTFL